MSKMASIARLILYVTAVSSQSTFTCDDGQVVPMAHVNFCIGMPPNSKYPKCHDGSDERVANFSTYPEVEDSPYIACRNNRSFFGPKVCALRRTEFCKGFIPCTGKTLCDGACSSHFQCPNSTCWKRSTVCDGDPCNDCPAFQSWSSGYGFKCVKNDFLCNLPQFFLWDGVADCDDKSDLCYTAENGDVRDFRNTSTYFNDLQCFRCQSGSIVVSKSGICDGVDDCPDASDERGCEKTVNSLGLASVNGRCECFDVDGGCSALGTNNNPCGVAREQLCQTLLAPCTGEASCRYGCPSHFRCPDSACWKRSAVCDDDFCNDCPGFMGRMEEFGFQCTRNGASCILPQLLLWDLVGDCDDSSDLCFATAEELDADLAAGVRDVRNLSSTTFNHSLCFQCIFDPTIIPKDRVYDGKVDCPDKSDECLCAKQSPELSCGEFAKLGENGNGSRSICDEARGAFFKQKLYCTHPYDNRAYWLFDNTLLCDGKRDCDGYIFQLGLWEGTLWVPRKALGHDESTLLCAHRKHCNTTDGLRNIAKSKVCDGIYDCMDWSDEVASELDGVYEYKICDGFVNCRNLEDESNATCFDKDRRYCSALGGAKVSIGTYDICDLNINCDDQSDEMNCMDDERFYCENQIPLFVTKDKKFNGVGDCSDWSDECPIKTKGPAADVFSSRYELIANPVLRAFVWIMVLLAICGNLVVIVVETKLLATTKSQNAAHLANHLLILNLSVSDLLMGVYLAMLGAAGAAYAGNYCANDLRWRASAVCTAMGILVSLSSESSVFTMVLLTTFRLYAVTYPFEASSKPRLKLVALSVLFAWAVSFVIALVPLTPQLQYFFETRAWLSESPFFGNVVVDFSSMQDYQKRLATFHRNFSDGNLLELEKILMKVNGANSWMDFKGILRHYNYTSMFDASGYFGYYSTNSVCINKWYVTPSDKAWPYTMFIVTVNFLAFTFVSFTYAWIYLKSAATARPSMRRSGGGRAETQNKDMQKKIIRLIFTDFCCWVPISIMAFLNFGGIPVPPVMYAVSAIILLPINSSLNPLIYSNAFQAIIDRIVAVCRRTPQQ